MVASTTPERLRSTGIVVAARRSIQAGSHGSAASFADWTTGGRSP